MTVGIFAFGKRPDLADRYHNEAKGPKTLFRWELFP